MLGMSQEGGVSNTEMGDERRQNGGVFMGGRVRMEERCYRAYTDGNYCTMDGWICGYTDWKRDVKLAVRNEFENNKAGVLKKMNVLSLFIHPDTLSFP